MFFFEMLGSCEKVGFRTSENSLVRFEGDQAFV